MKRKKTAMILGLAAMLTVCACGKQPEVQQEVQQPAEETVNETEQEMTVTGEAVSTEEESEEIEVIEPEVNIIEGDRSGNEVEIPKDVETIISMAPSTTRVLLDLGLADKIVAVDTNSQYSYGAELNADIPAFDMMAPDLEQLVALAPDIIFTSGMSSRDGEDAFQAVRDAGICVADIPSSDSIKGIVADIMFIGDCVGEQEQAEELVQVMDEVISAIVRRAEAIPEEEKKTVLFELYTPSPDYPTIYTAGSNTYINEMIELVGAINIAGDMEEQWPALTEEACVAADPQVILTADMYTPDVINTILNMEGWEEVTAIKEGEVYQLDADEVNQPNNHIVGAMIDMATFIYPEYFEDLLDEIENLLPAA